MGDSLREQMLKLGLVTEKQAREAGQSRRADRKRKGRAGVQAEQDARLAEADAARAAEQAKARARERSRQSAREARETALRAAQIAASGRLPGRVDGPRRFYFEARDGRVPYLELNDEVAAQVERGQVAICESATGEVWLIDAEAAGRVAALDDRWLRAGAGAGLRR